jgi:hypothetical protein
MRTGAETLMIILTLLLSVAPIQATPRIGPRIDLLATSRSQSAISRGVLNPETVQGAQGYSAYTTGKAPGRILEWHGGTIFAARDSAETEGVTLFVLGALLLGVATSLRLKIMRRTERETVSELSRHTNH